MKKSIMLVGMAATVMIILCACGKDSSSLPALNALSSLPESTIREVVVNYKRDALLTGWGTPESTMEGNLGDTWLMNDGRELQVIYDEYGKVFVVRINE